MRLRRALCPLTFVWLLALRSSAQPAPAPAPAKPGAPDPSAAAARAHFKQGVKLYRDASYAPALAEFEAAYAAKPSAGRFKLALCLKALNATMLRLAETPLGRARQGAQQTEARRPIWLATSSRRGGFYCPSDPLDSHVTDGIRFSDERAGRFA